MKKSMILAAALLLSLQLAVPAFADAAAPGDPRRLLNAATPNVILWIAVAAVLALAAVIGILHVRRKKKKQAQKSDNQTEGTK